MFPTVNGRTPAGQVMFGLTGEMTDTTAKTHTPAGPVMVTVPASGSIAVQVPANDDTTTTPGGRQYFVRERLAGATERSYYVTVPHLPSGARAVTDGVLTAGSPTLISATAAFVAGDVGAYVTGPGIPPLTTILAILSATTATLSASATISGSAVAVLIRASVDLSILAPAQ